MNERYEKGKVGDKYLENLEIMSNEGGESALLALDLLPYGVAVMSMIGPPMSPRRERFMELMRLMDSQFIAAIKHGVVR